MFINADFSAPAAISPQDYKWVASPQPGVERVMLDRVGGEVARATSLVRYAHNSSFPPHKHPGGEEILVLSGTFSDESGDYPAGWYLRNPPQSTHRPHSNPGALILVKLHQMKAREDRTVRINTLDRANWRTADGREFCPLFSDAAEQAWVERLRDGQTLVAADSGGLEAFVLSGVLSFEGAEYPEGSWLRLPKCGGSAITAAGACKVFVKTGHLPGVDRQEVYQ